ncbi:hypothetical protein AJ80_01360 [Polytolypa hystricis UAMH7299]|uniref:Uncharacterized protein n=1 Tax=Polytolypa hystricis (strain UAMH7299) TaxID=1447883 RepID=A0A2B7YZ66_POLH7|nr:hypothetical protein AJ80_01360 [Polytolypa hystricis UAMH7299]
MATVVVQQQPARHSATPPPITPALSLNASTPRSQTPIPNKHLPVCPPGPPPPSSKIPATPPQSPTLKHPSLTAVHSFLFPPDKFPKLCNSPPIYAIDSDNLAFAIEERASQPLPDPKNLFPWLHGLHPNNHIQLSFFVSRRRSLRRTPKCLREITVVKVGGDLSRSRIKGAVAPQEIITPSGATFFEADPPEGFSVRNFHIQPAKLAPLSDIIVYGEDGTDESEIFAFAAKVAMAQRDWRRKYDPGQETQLFNTFVLSTPFQEFHNRHPELVSVDAQGVLTGHVMDYFQWERIEMCNMSAASEISNNVWQGPSPDVIPGGGNSANRAFDVLIETHDVANIPDPRYLTKLTAQLDQGPQTLEFPSSGSVLAPSWSHVEVYDLIDMCRWIYQITNPEDQEQSEDADGDIPMVSMTPKARKVLIHCADGYTESSLLAIAYFMFAEGVPVHEAWLRLHCQRKRNFFAYPSDVTFLTSIQDRLLSESPAAAKRQPGPANSSDPGWLARMDGSLPSRILPYMYLGNLTHANNPELLWSLGIRRLLSIGEPVSWPPSERERWGADNLMMIDDVQDNGIDPLTQAFHRCLEFIEKGKRDGTATLVHCRVGVSRSATICIAEVMASMGLSFSRAYCFVRARRLNVIIQPHLRFVYELLKWDEQLQQKRNQPIKRELEWASVSREIALMNKPYSKQQ